MKFVLVVLAALGLTLMWQASVVAEHPQRAELAPIHHQGLIAPPAPIRRS